MLLLVIMGVVRCDGDGVAVVVQLGEGGGGGGEDGRNDIEGENDIALGGGGG